MEKKMYYVARLTGPYLKGPIAGPFLTFTEASNHGATLFNKGGMKVIVLKSTHILEPVSPAVRVRELIEDTPPKGFAPIGYAAKEVPATADPSPKVYPTFPLKEDY